MNALACKQIYCESSDHFTTYQQSKLAEFARRVLSHYIELPSGLHTCGYSHPSEVLFAWVHDHSWATGGELLVHWCRLMAVFPCFPMPSLPNYHQPLPSSVDNHPSAVNVSRESYRLLVAIGPSSTVVSHDYKAALRTESSTPGRVRPCTCAWTIGSGWRWLLKPWFISMESSANMMI